MSIKGQSNVRVTTADTELQFGIQNKTTGKALFDQIISTTGIRENWYFGLQYIDRRNQPAWLNMKDKVLKQDIKKDGIIYKLDFKFRFYPENVADEVIQDVTLKNLFVQVKEDILNEAIYCPAEKAVLLASYQVQAKFMDYSEEFHAPGYLANEKLLPKTVIDQHKLSLEEWENKVSVFHKQHRGTPREEAMLEYLKIAQDLEMFGVNYFAIYNTNKTEMLLGVDALGINVYDKSNKLAPKISFPWSEIKNISHTAEKFKVKLNEKNVKPFEGTTKEPKTAKKIYEICAGNHDMYVKRRRPDTLEIQQMKEQKREEAKQKARERDALKREIRAREELEVSKEETLQKYKALQAEMENYKHDLDEARRTIEDLQKQLLETTEARKQLEEQQDELRALMTKLEADRNMELDERQKLEEEIRKKQEEIEEVKNVVDEKDEETKRLQEEMAEAKRQLEETTATMNQRVEEATAVTEAAIVEVEQETVQENGIADSASDEPYEQFEDENRDIDNAKEALLQELRSNLEEAKDETKVTEEDRQYQLLVDGNRDKFKTLREIRSGATKRRIDKFENM